MKTNDLMIGNWVSYKGTNEANNHFKVAEILSDKIVIIAEGRRWYAEPKYCEPIPLTAEILEKNGFEGRNYCYLKIDDFSYLEYYSFEHRLRKIYNGVDEWENHAVVRDIIFQCHCTYVHELQHALKLCGIEKEIEL